VCRETDHRAGEAAGEEAERMQHSADRPGGGDGKGQARAWLAVALLVTALGWPACAKGGTGTAPGVCGNGVLEKDEQCDGLEPAGIDCGSLGMGMGALKCNADCTFDTSGCSNASQCGNGVIEGLEYCDGLDLGGKDCTSLNLGTGALTCTATCEFDTSGCSMFEQCGNGVVEGNEQCDGYNLNGKNCVSVAGQTYSGGTLACKSDCTFDTSGCTSTGPVCGNDLLEAGEACDGNQFQGGASCVSMGFGGGQLGCKADCTLDTSGCTAAAEVCGNGTDDDGDGYIDCNDADCLSDPSCGGSPEVCNDGQDNDNDGFVDCDDADCSNDPSCQSSGSEICNNGVDDDGIFGCDCADLLSCILDVTCLLSPSTETACSDGQDDDHDCLVDCADDDCASDPACGGTPPEVCDNGTDDDGDGAVDCDDSDCAGAAGCPVCGGAVAIDCGQQGSGDTTGGQTNFSSEYQCSSYDETGPEAYLVFTATADQSVTVDLAGSGSADLDLVVVGADSSGDCDPSGHCVDASQTSGVTEQVVFNAVSGTTYYFIVEGYGGDAGPFDLTVTCN